MELEITGIKCDTKHCNYRDDSVQFVDYPKWIDRPCPVCSGNLLTQKDYKSCLNTLKIVRVITVLRWVNPFFYLKSAYLLLTGKKGKTYSHQVKFENDGSLTQTQKQEE